MKRVVKTLLGVFAITIFVGVGVIGFIKGISMLYIDNNLWGTAILLITFAYWMTPVIWWTNQ